MGFSAWLSFVGSVVLLDGGLGARGLKEKPPVNIGVAGLGSLVFVLVLVAAGGKRVLRDDAQPCPETDPGTATAGFAYLLPNKEASWFLL